MAVEEVAEVVIRVEVSEAVGKAGKHCVAMDPEVPTTFVKVGRSVLAATIEVVGTINLVVRSEIEGRPQPRDVVVDTIMAKVMVVRKMRFSLRKTKTGGRSRISSLSDLRLKI